MSTGLRRIVISGPESTGKTSLVQDLSRHFNGLYINEYARKYISELKRPYIYEDVEHIAEVQVKLEKEMLGKTGQYLFYDTWLVITKVWFNIAFGRYPGWIDEYLENADIDLFLLCYPDLPWVADQVRENPGEMRMKLFHMYRKEAENFGFPVVVIKGSNQLRCQSAIRAVNDFISKDY